MDIIEQKKKILEKLRHTKLRAVDYGKDIQRVLDHFGVGKIVSAGEVSVVDLLHGSVFMGIVETTKGYFLFIEISDINGLDYCNKAVKALDETLQLDMPVKTQTTGVDVYLAHLANSYFALRKV